VAGIDTLLLALADVQGTHGDQRPLHWSRYLRHARELFAYAYSPDGLARVQSQPLLDGHTLMTQLHLLPGKQIGALLDQIAEAQAAGEVANRDEALELAARLAGL
jgi:poly(A) polymerase/tRNA nucleotidyltransferase (CCA-adding enzyme)